MKPRLLLRLLVSTTGLVLASCNPAPTQQAASPGVYISPQSFPDLPPTADYDVAPKVIDSYAPYFPHAEFLNHRSGKVVLGFTVGIDGSPRDVRVIETTTQGFANEALYAIQKWRFAPAKKDGKPVPARIKLPITFTRKYSGPR